MASPNKFDRVMDFILLWEGEYSYNPDDPGGETNFGISKRANPDVDIKNLTREKAIEIYRNRYWKRINGEGRPFPEALAVMDFAVNSGVQTALWYWEGSRGVQDYIFTRIDYLRVIRNGRGELLFPIFGRGWIARVTALQRIIHEHEKSPDVELVQLFTKNRTFEFTPIKVTIGQTVAGRKKIMVRL